jgi:acetyl-CoA acetyltransferase family protein
VLSGNQDCVIAGGVEVMSLVPIGSDVQVAVKNGRGFPNGENIKKKYGLPVFSQFEGAERLAKKCDITREELDQLAVESHKRAQRATVEGRFKKEIVPIKGQKEGKEFVLDYDEGIRPQTTLDSLRALKPLQEGGRITAANASQITDGASAMLICNERGLKKLGLKPRAKIIQMSVVGDDPLLMLYGPIPATKKVLKDANLKMEDMALYEVNEAFGSVPLAWAKELHADMNKLNVNGGAMALGHPLGSTGTKIMTTLVHELERTGQRYGLQAICEGGGTANATIIENLSAGKSKL